MFRNLLLAAAIGLACVASTQATLTPFYTTLSDGGNPASPSEVDFISSPGLQFRLISVNYQSDTNNAQLQVSTGGAACAITATNPTTSTVTNVLDHTAGLNPGSILFLEHAGTAYLATLSSTNNSTNAVLAAGGWGVLPSIGDNVYQMGTATTIPIGAGTNWLNGEAIYIGNVGRPVRVVLTPTLNTNNLPAATGRYE